MNEHEKLNYLEFPARDFAGTKNFFSKVFGWTFEDYGPAYTAFSNAGIEGGFYQADMAADVSKGSALVVFYSNELEATLAKVEAAGGEIAQEIFSFPGGRRFHLAIDRGDGARAQDSSVDL